jgi:hypothetical protein
MGPSGPAGRAERPLKAFAATSDQDGASGHEEDQARMATIRASCGDCGDVELTTSDVRVRVCTDTNEGEYLFRCPRCTMTVVKAAEPRTIDLLVASGVAMQTWSLPAELWEPRYGSPITHDDLLDFHECLTDEALFSAAVDGIRQS